MQARMGNLAFCILFFNTIARNLKIPQTRGANAETMTQYGLNGDVNTCRHVLVGLQRRNSDESFNKGVFYCDHCQQRLVCQIAQQEKNIESENYAKVYNFLRQTEDYDIEEEVKFILKKILKEKVFNFKYSKLKAYVDKSKSVDLKKFTLIEEFVNLMIFLKIFEL